MRVRGKQERERERERESEREREIEHVGHTYSCTEIDHIFFNQKLICTLAAQSNFSFFEG